MQGNLIFEIYIWGGDTCSWSWCWCCGSVKQIASIVCFILALIPTYRSRDSETFGSNFLQLQVYCPLPAHAALCLHQRPSVTPRDFLHQRSH
jgi:hypothetical protein